MKWINKFLPNDFGHCRVVLHQNQIDVLVDTRMSYLDIRVYEKGVKFNAPVELKISRMVDVSQLRGVFGLQYCVEQVKMVLGIKKWWLVTPYQLYKFLIKESKSVK